MTQDIENPLVVSLFTLYAPSSFSVGLLGDWVLYDKS